jgi:hypothetical protein
MKVCSSGGSAHRFSSLEKGRVRSMEIGLIRQSGMGKSAPGVARCFLLYACAFNNKESP